MGDLGAMHVLQLKLVGKPIVNFLLAVTEHFLLAVTVAELWALISQNDTAVIFSLYSNQQMALGKSAARSMAGEMQSCRVLSEATNTVFDNSCSNCIVMHLRQLTARIV